MKFSAATVSLFVSSLAIGAVAANLESRWNAELCNDLGLDSKPDYALALMDACEDEVKEANDNNFFVHNSCVAASTVLTPGLVADVLGCNTKTGLDFTKSKVDNLPFRVYADMVGECAYNQPDACSISQQNYYDFLFQTLDEACTDEWPSAEDAAGWWTTISDWTMTGETSPYKNFDDFLHYY